jgi:hypothetical protein
MNIEIIKEHPDKKFIESFFYGDNNEEWEVETDSGWAEVKAVGKTIKYQIYELKTDSCNLLCADNHIIFKRSGNINKEEYEIKEAGYYSKDNNYQYDKKTDIFSECFVVNIFPGDEILTVNGIERVESVTEIIEKDNMYDLQLNNTEKRFYTNGILSHNSMWLCNLACQGVRQGYDVAYISLEMSETKIIKRLACNLLNIPSKEYNTLSEDGSYIKKRFSSIASDALSIPGALRVKEFPTSTASVTDVENWLKRMEERMQKRFKLVVIDYIGIMRNYRNANSENSYMKIKQIAEDLRAMAMRNEWCIVTASQFNRGAYNSNDVILEQIAESAALIHTVDGLFGIIQDEIMLMNSEYLLKTLANREEGYKNSKKRFMISYDYSRITEDLNSEILTPSH